MKLKMIILLALFAAGVFASMALAENDKRGKKKDDGCREVHVSGTIAPQTLAVTVDKASSKLGIAAGTQLSLAVGAAGQTVRVKAEVCATGTAGALTFTLKQAELRPERVKAIQTTTGGTVTGGTTTRKHDDGDDDHKDKGKGKGRDKGRTTTVGTTTTAPTTTTTTATTTTAPTTTTGTTTTTP
jgi:hypothetical protein